MSEILNLNKKDFKKGLIMAGISTFVTTVGGAIITLFNQVAQSIQAGNYNIDFRQIIVSILASFVIGLLLGVVSAIHYFLKNLFTDENDKFLGKF